MRPRLILFPVGAQLKPVIMHLEVKSWIMKPALLIFAILFLAGSCEVKEVQKDPEIRSVSVVEFYYLQDEEKLNGYDSQIDEAAAKIADTVLISYDEILSYNAKTYTFTVTEEARKRLEFFRPFAVTVDSVIIYTGYFWTSLSSRSVDWVVIDLISMTGNENELKVQLGYPGQWDGLAIPDKRNDPRILEVFREDGKLIE